MDALTYLKTLDEICQNQNNCSNCPITPCSDGPYVERIRKIENYIEAQKHPSIYEILRRCYDESESTLSLYDWMKATSFEDLLKNEFNH